MNVAPITDFRPPAGYTLALDERDFSTNPVGYCSGNFDLPPIPRNEWADLIREMEESQSSLVHIREVMGPNGGHIPALDQQATNFCVTEDTEILTDKGWVPYPEYNWTDLLATMNPITGMLEYQQCLKKHVYEHNGPMVYGTKKSLDFAVTPDHRMLVRKWDESKRTLSSQYQFQRAGELGWYCGLPASTKGFVGTELVEIAVEDDRAYDGDDFIAMLSMVISDGYVGGTDKTRNWVSFACTVDYRYEMAKALAARIGFRESPSKPGIFIRYNAGALANWIRKHCYSSPELGAFNKRVPQIVKESSSRQIKHFLTVYGDQSHKSSQQTFFSVSKRLVDDIQEMLLKIGVRGNIRKASVCPPSVLKNGQVATPRHPVYHITAKTTDKLSLERKNDIETETYKGLVFCATVPNGTLITRRNGTVLISGNCWAYSSVGSVMMTRAVAGQPYVALSGTSVGAKIKNFRNQGGYGSQSLEFIASKGVCTQADWPEGTVGLRREFDTPMAWQNAKQFRIEKWMDLDPRDIDQLMACLLRRIPVVSDFNWWRHSVLSMRATAWDGRNLKTDILNSWGDRWGTKGLGGLSGSKAIPDGMIAPRIVTAS